MEIATVKEKLSLALAEPEDDAKYGDYIKSYVALLEQDKITADTVSLAYESVSLDQGVNFIDTFVTLKKKEAQEAWNLVRKSEAFKANKDFQAVKLMCSFAASAIGGDEATTGLLGNILNALVISSTEDKTVKPEVYTILKDDIIGQLPKDIKAPEWKGIKISVESGLAFCGIMNNVLSLSEASENATDYPASFLLKKWISEGRKYLEEKQELQEREKNKPPKKSEELVKLVDHFKQLEDELDKAIHENVTQALEIKRLNEDISNLYSDKRALEEKCKALEAEINALNNKVNQANQEVDERKKLNDAQVQYREDAKAALLQDIATALKAEYGDYADTREAPMNEMLGEIYREKLKQIFKILEQKGIKVGE